MHRASTAFHYSPSFFLFSGTRFPHKAIPNCLSAAVQTAVSPSPASVLRDFYLLTFLFPDTIYNQPIEKLPLEECAKLAKTCEKLASAHLKTLLVKPDYHNRLSVEIHHVCDKYDSLVRECLPFELDGVVLRWLYGCVFSLFLSSISKSRKVCYDLSAGLLSRQGLITNYMGL